MPRSLVQNYQEMDNWIIEGKSYNWIVEQYAKPRDEGGYDLEIKPAMIGNYRARRGLPKRRPRYEDLIPWDVAEPHRGLYLLEMLRLEAQVRAGAVLTGRNKDRHESFLQNLTATNTVVLYDPESEKGFYYVPREATDDDIIRRPV